MVFLFPKTGDLIQIEEFFREFGTIGRRTEAKFFLEALAEIFWVFKPDLITDFGNI